MSESPTLQSYGDGATRANPWCRICDQYVGCRGECSGELIDCLGAAPWARPPRPGCFRQIANRPGDVDPETGDWLGAEQITEELIGGELSDAERQNVGRASRLAHQITQTEADPALSTGLEQAGSVPPAEPAHGPPTPASPHRQAARTLPQSQL